MLPDRDLGHLADIRKYGTRALSHVEGMTFAEFTDTAVKIDAVIHCLTVIGEAGTSFRPSAGGVPQFDWSAMTGMRHRLVHDYGRTDYEIVWDVVQNKLPALCTELTAYLARFP